MNRTIRVYVAGPISRGDTLANIATAIDAAERIYALGFFPFVPHTMTAMWHMRYPKPHEAWVAFDLKWLRLCNALFRIPGESEGADIEVARALDWGIPVVRDFDQLAAAFPDVRPPAAP